jgi:hypothetical protein
MSKLRSKLASIENNANKGKKMKKQRKCASTLDVTFTGYRAENEEGMEIYMETSDPELRQKIKDNSLSEGERNFLISMAGEYFEKVVVQDEKLFDMTIGRPIIAHYLGDELNDILPDDLINEDALPLASQKNQKTKEIQFNKNKFRRLPMEDKAKFVTDLMLVFTEVWADSFYSKETDIKNLITIPGIEDEGDVEAAKKPACGEGVVRTRKFRRKYVCR